jgi:hypothetical protein
VFWEALNFDVPTALTAGSVLYNQSAPTVGRLGAAHACDCSTRAVARTGHSPREGDRHALVAPDVNQDAYSGLAGDAIGTCAPMACRDHAQRTASMRRIPAHGGRVAEYMIPLSDPCCPLAPKDGQRRGVSFHGNTDAAEVQFSSLCALGSFQRLENLGEFVFDFHNLAIRSEPPGN